MFAGIQYPSQWFFYDVNMLDIACYRGSWVRASEGGLLWALSAVIMFGVGIHASCFKQSGQASCGCTSHFKMSGHDNQPRVCVAYACVFLEYYSLSAELPSDGRNGMYSCIDCPLAVCYSLAVCYFFRSRTSGYPAVYPNTCSVHWRLRPNSNGEGPREANKATVECALL